MLSEAAAALAALAKQLDAWEVQRLLGGAYDDGPALVSIYAGTGGDDASDWAEMLERMYLRWCDARGFSVRVLDRTVSEGAGIKSVDFEVTGRYAFGLLLAEKGTHRCGGGGGGGGV